MKYLVYIAIFASALCVSTFSPTMSPAAIITVEPTDRIDAPPVELLKKIQTEVTNGVKSAQERLNNVDKASYYEKWEAKDSTTGKIKTIKDLDDKQLRGFFILQAEKLHQELVEMTDGWAHGLILLRQAEVPKPADPTVNKTPAKKAEKSAEQKKYEEHVAVLKETVRVVEKACDDLHVVHKKLAQKREDMVSDLIYLYKDKDKDLVKELEDYLKSVKSENDKLGLIDRSQQERKK